MTKSTPQRPAQKATHGKPSKQKKTTKKPPRLNEDSAKKCLDKFLRSPLYTNFQHMDNNNFTITQTKGQNGPHFQVFCKACGRQKGFRSGVPIKFFNETSLHQHMKSDLAGIVHRGIQQVQYKSINVKGPAFIVIKLPETVMKKPIQPLALLAKKITSDKKKKTQCVSRGAQLLEGKLHRPTKDPNTNSSQATTCNSPKVSRTT